MFKTHDAKTLRAKDRKRAAKGSRKVQKSVPTTSLVAWHSWTVAQASSVSLSINVHQVASRADVAERIFAKGARKARERKAKGTHDPGGYLAKARLTELLALVTNLRSGLRTVY